MTTLENDGQKAVCLARLCSPSSVSWGSFDLLHRCGLGHGGEIGADRDKTCQDQGSTIPSSILP